jgi:hypothetical protein
MPNTLSKSCCVCGDPLPPTGTTTNLARLLQPAGEEAMWDPHTMITFKANVASHFL